MKIKITATVSTHEIKVIVEGLDDGLVTSLKNQAITALCNQTTALTALSVVVE